ncbi:hypothetical protein MMC07_004447 [Pseudocyphellaria aurata]|nr:hypothetical protein [Pseudocyphellaria aurata]
MSSATTASATTTTYANFAAFAAATGKPAKAPPGVTPNPNASNPNGVFMVFINVVAVILCTTITAMRLWTKSVLLRSVGWDDWTAAPLIPPHRISIPPRSDGNFLTDLAKKGSLAPPIWNLAKTARAIKVMYCPRWHQRQSKKGRDEWR